MYTVYYKLYAQQASLAKFLFESLKVQKHTFWEDTSGPKREVPEQF